ncbi:MAG: DMT family transporter [Rhizobiaceae bacterium]
MTTIGPAQKAHHNALGFLLGIVGVAIFAATLPATHIALEDYSPWFITHARALIASLAALVTLLSMRRTIPRGHLTALLSAGLLLVFGFPGFMAIGMQTVGASHGGVVLGILPLATAVFAALIGGERPSPLFWLCGIAGTALVVLFAVRDSGMRLVMGDVWLFLAGLSASLGYVISGRLSRMMPGWAVICWALVLTMPLSALGTLLTFQPAFVQASAKAVTALAYLGLGSMLVGFFAWNAGLAMGGIARVGQVQLLQTFFTIAVSALLLGEPVTGEMLAFAVAVVAVVALGRKARISA